MKFYLSSLKLGNKTEELKKWIKEHDNKICLIPNARDVYPDGERKTSKIYSDVQELTNLGFEVTILSLKDYFNKMLMQIGKIEAKTGDQDFINYCFHKKIKLISYKWNMYHKFHFESYGGKQPLEDRDYADAVQNPKIVHFVGPDKPWNPGSCHPYKECQLHHHNVSISLRYSEP